MKKITKVLWNLIDEGSYPVKRLFLQNKLFSKLVCKSN